jgi:hypothetical protein
VIDASDPYRNDALDRKQFGDRLKNLITRAREELVICLDAPWGEGKTTFVLMWQKQLERENIPSIYFDAFANDYIDNAFIAIAGEISAFAKKHLHDDPKQTKLGEFKKKASEIGVQLLPWAAKMAIKAATLNVVKGSDVEELMEIRTDIATGSSSVVSKFIEDRISKHTDEIDNVEAFKTTLEELAKQIGGTTDNPLVIIIDELDRCKPTYAVSVIERIKHMFSVRKLVFILVMHKTQLEQAIKSVYGQDIDAISYVQKFINIDCTLPKITDAEGPNDYDKYCRTLFRLHELGFLENEVGFLESISTLARIFNLSLRQLEKTFTYISIFYASVPDNFVKLSPLLCFLSIVKVFKPEIYRGLKYGNLSYTDVIESLHIKEPEANHSAESRVLYWLKFCLLTVEEAEASSLIDQFVKTENQLLEYNINRGGIIPLYCDYLDFVRMN